MVDDQLYSTHPDLIDWDQGVEEWKEDIMGQWPFGIQPTVEASGRSIKLSGPPRLLFAV